MSVPTDQPGSVDELEETHLEGQGERFLLGLEKVRRGELDAAADIFRGILKVEPRLAEPRLELARVLLDTNQLDDAEGEAREGLRVLKAGGVWVEDIEENVLMSMAKGMLGEILRRSADRDEVVFGDPDRWKALMEESRKLYIEAAELDPGNDHARAWAFGMARQEDEDEADEEVDLDSISLIPEGLTEET